MKNLWISQDQTFSVANLGCDLGGEESAIVSVAVDYLQNEILLLFSNGVLLGLPYQDGQVDLNSDRKESWNLNDFVEDDEQGSSHDNSWFVVTVIPETSSIVCISHLGNIVSIKCEEDSSNRLPTGDHEGVIDGGIASAAWSPDQSVLLFATNNASIIAMSNTWDVLHEFPIEAFDSSLPCRLSWSGDSEYFTILSTDIADKISKIRFYSKDFELKSVARHVAEGDAGVIKGIGKALACSNNGILSATSMLKAKKWTICLLERNGLSHGGFDIQSPKIAEGYSEWTVENIHWDLTSSSMAVTLQSTNNSSPNVKLGCVQVYYRNNYHWYLKQESMGKGLLALGFDAEATHRLYTSQIIDGNSVLRVLGFHWDTFSSDTSDGSVAVVDGSNVRLSPLGVACVPPPMYQSSLPLSAAVTSLSFFAAPQPFAWGLVALCSDGVVHIATADSRGNIVGTVTALSLDNYKGIAFRSVQLVCGPQPTEPLSPFTATLFIVGSHVATTGKLGESSCDEIVVTSLRLTPTQISSQRIELTCDVLATAQMKHSETAIIRVVTCPDLEVRQDHGMDMLSDVGSFSESNNAHVDREQIRDVREDSTLFSSHEVVAIATSESWDDMIVSVYRIDDLFGTSSQSLSEIIPITTFALPETCYSISILSQRQLTSPGSTRRGPGATGASATLHHTAVAVGLSDKNRLYANDVLLVPGASSFLSHATLEALLYITVGTQPQLHFLSATAVLDLDPLRAEDQIILDLGYPRPVERGARLVAVARDKPRVILQMPRGNLEAFEPRPLLLIQIRDLLESGRIVDALLLCKRQRIDMNLVVDHAPGLFAKQLGIFLREVLSKQSETLSLLITSLEDTNVTYTKYPNLHHTSHIDESFYMVPVIRDRRRAKKDNNQSAVNANANNLRTSDDVNKLELFSKLGFSDSYTSMLTLDADTVLANELSQDATQPQALCDKAYQIYGGKTNYFCRLIRDELLTILSSENDFNALHPILVTCCKNSPPLIHEALFYIREYYSSRHEGETRTKDTTSAHGYDNVDISEMEIASAVYRSPKFQSSIKYLTFLTHSEALFNAALVEGDFDMAKAIARQCQMDPKSYLPLIEGFEVNLGDNKSQRRKGPVFELMRFKIAMHLQQEIHAIHAVLKCFNLMCTELGTSSGSTVNFANTAIGSTDLTKELVGLVKNNKVYNEVLPFLASLRTHYLDTTRSDIGAAGLHPSFAFVRELVHDTIQAVQKSFAEHCASIGDFHQANLLYLTLSPPLITEAVKLKIQHRRFNEALMLSMRYGGDKGSQSAHKTAQEIVSSFRESLEQGEQSDELYGGDSQVSNDTTAEEQSTLVSLEVAQIALQYLNDCESAIAILLLSKQYNEAIRIAVTYNRLDLLGDDISQSLRSHVKDMLKMLQSFKSRVNVLVEQLQDIWKNPIERLELISKSEPHLFESEEEKKDKEKNNETDNFNDRASEYSNISRLSKLSYRSQLSQFSHLSQRSGQSQHSNTSSVSVLSNLSVNSNTSKTPNSQFAIEGIEHTLLSRGSVNENGNYGNEHSRKNKKNKGIQQQQQQKQKRDKNSNKDQFQLKLESNLCTEFVNMIQTLTKMSKSVFIDVFQSVVILQCNQISDIEQVKQMLKLFDEIVILLRQLNIPIAPKYPMTWLTAKNMKVVEKFQLIQVDTLFSSEEDNFQVSSTNVPSIVAMIKSVIEHWMKLRKSCYLP